MFTITVIDISRTGNNQVIIKGISPWINSLKSEEKNNL